MSYSDRYGRINKKHHDDCACPDSKDKHEKCDCCCVQGIKSALEDAKGRNIAIRTSTLGSRQIIVGRVTELDCDTVLLAAPVPAVTTSPVATLILARVVTPTRFSLCEIDSVFTV